MPHTKLQVSRKFKAVVSTGRFQFITIDTGPSAFPLKKNQCDELTKWCSGATYDAEWLVVDKDGARFVANDGQANQLVLADDAWKSEKEIVADKWKELKSSKNFDADYLELQVGDKAFGLRENQIKELVKWAASKKYDKKWLVVADDIPMHFEGQDDSINALVITAAAWAGASEHAKHKGKHKSEPVEEDESPVPKKKAKVATPPKKKTAPAKTAAASPGGKKNLVVPGDFWEVTSTKPKPFTPTGLKKTEEALGYYFPRSYLQLMSKQNGGIPTKTAFQDAEKTDYSMSISDFSSIDELIGQQQNCVEEWEYPNIGVYICNCPSGGHDMICLDYSKCGPKGEPQVSHVDQEGDFAVTVLAPTFADFIAGLVKIPDDY